MASSVHQKQPAAKVALASPDGWPWAATEGTAMAASQIGRIRSRGYMAYGSFQGAAGFIAVKTDSLRFSSAGTSSTTGPWGYANARAGGGYRVNAGGRVSTANA